MTVRGNRELIVARASMVMLVLLLGAGALCWRLWVVQVKKHDYYFDRARERYTVEVSTRGKRGEVFDRKGNLLVGNQPCEVIVADPALISDEQVGQLTDVFCGTLGVDRADTLRRLTTRQRKIKRADGSERTVIVRYAVIARQVPLDAAAAMRERLAKIKPGLTHKAVYEEEDYIRVYPKGRLLANVLGFTSYSRGEDVAVSGVESSFNRAMMPGTGRTRYERARTGGQIFYGLREITREETDGFNIYLTIDEALQQIVEEELDKMVEKFSPRAASIIMADPKTGEILALAQRPTFNPNERSKAAMSDSSAWRLLCIENTFEPGSIMKGLSISLALDAGVITPNTVFNGYNGTWIYRGKPLSDSTKRGQMDVRTAVQKSSNIVTAQIGLLLGEKRLYDGLKRFGIGERTGVPLSPESRGMITNYAKWDGLMITRVPIGYAVGVTPMQMVRAYCALADGGNLRTLKLFHHAENAATGEIIEPEPETPVQVFTHPEVAAVISDMLKAVTKEGGTAKNAGVPGFETAGKTGTSRKVVGRHYSPGKYNSTFIGFVPADRPAFVLLVTLDEPKGAIYGGITAAPTFSAIAERALKYLDVSPDPELSEKPKK